MKDINIIIAENIKEMRKVKCIAQAELAELADISIETVKRAERMKSVTLDSILRIAKALGTNPVSILEDEKQNSYIKRFAILIAGKSNNEKEYILFLVKKIVEANFMFNNN